MKQYNILLEKTVSLQESIEELGKRGFQVTQALPITRIIHGNYDGDPQALWFWGVKAIEENRETKSVSPMEGKTA